MIIAAAAGLLAGCPTVDLGDTPADIGTCRPDRTYFDTQIWPNYVLQADTPTKSCTANGGCHNAQNSPESALRFQTNPEDLNANYTNSTRFLNCGNPDSSDMLTKPREIISHGGDMILGPSDPEVQLFLDWFNQ